MIFDPPALDCPNVNREDVYLGFYGPARAWGQFTNSESGFQGVRLGQIPNPKGWNSYVHRELSRNYESTILILWSLSMRTDRSCCATGGDFAF